MLTRILTGLVGVPIVVWLLHSGGMLFNAAIFVLAAIGWLEFYNMAKNKGYNVFYFSSGIMTLVLVGSLMYLDDSIYTLYSLPLFLVVTIIAILLEGLYKHCKGHLVENVGLSVMAVLYIGILFFHFGLLRQLPFEPVVIGSFVLEGGECFFWLIMLGTWASDTFAYFVGCAIGKRKLCPNVSPNKSVEGAAAGFIGCLAVMVYLGVKVLDMEIAQAAALGLCVAVFAPLGDLVESILKRSFGVKDSGKIFPGHGGVLDRCDSLLFAIPLGYYVLVFSVLLTKTH